MLCAATSCPFPFWRVSPHKVVAVRGRVRSIAVHRAADAVEIEVEMLAALEREVHRTTFVSKGIGISKQRTKQLLDFSRGYDRVHAGSWARRARASSRKNQNTDIFAGRCAYSTGAHSPNSSSHLSSITSIASLSFAFSASRAAILRAAHGAQS